MKSKNNFKIFLIAAIFLIYASGCSFFNKGEQSSADQNKSKTEKMQENGAREENVNLKGRVLRIEGNEVTIAKITDKGSGNSSSPKVGAKISPKDMGKFKLTQNTKVIIRNSYGYEGTGEGGRNEDRNGIKDDIKVGSFVEVWTEDGEDTTAKTVRVSIFSK